MVSWGQTIPVPSAAQADVIAITAGQGRTLARKRDGALCVWGTDAAPLLASPAEAQGALALAVTLSRNFALRADGSVFSWGHELPASLLPPDTVAADVVALAAGREQVLALKRDGTLVTWGTTSHGLQSPPLPARHGIAYPPDLAFAVPFGSSRAEIRTSSVPPVPTPVAVPLASLRARSLSAGYGNVFALRGDGGTVSWGSLNWSPAPAPTNPHFPVAVATGLGHLVTLRSDGTVLVNRTTGFDQDRVPPDATGLVAISAGPNYTLALRRDGRVVGWGTGPFNPPAAAQSNVVAIAAGEKFSLALKTDGSIVQWDEFNPSTVPVPSGAIAIATGLNHAAALKTDGTVVIWGTGTYPFGPTPVDAVDLVGIAITPNHLLGLRSDGRVVAWGENTVGQCTVPTAAQFDIVAIAATTGASYAMRSDGSLISWGNVPIVPSSALTSLRTPPAVSDVVITPRRDLLSTRYPLGAGIPSALKADGSVDLLGLTFPTYTGLAQASGLVSLTTLRGHALGLRADGTISTFLNSSSGISPYTIPPTANSGVVRLVSSGNHALALKSDGSVVAWGDNTYGQCNVPDLNPPTSDDHGYYFTAVAASYNTSFGLRSDGRVIAWGFSVSGLTTVPASALSDVVGLSADGNRVQALKRDGTVVTWGSLSTTEPPFLKLPKPVVELETYVGGSTYRFADSTLFSHPDLPVTDIISIAKTLTLSGAGVVRGNLYSGSPRTMTSVLRPGPPGAPRRLIIERPRILPSLSALTPSVGTLAPNFSPATSTYAISVGPGVSGLDLAATTTGGGVLTHRLNGSVFQPGGPSAEVLRTGSNLITLRLNPDSRPLPTHPIAITQNQAYAISSTGLLMQETLFVSGGMGGDMVGVYAGDAGAYALKADGSLLTISGTSLPTALQPTAPGITPALAPIIAVAVGRTNAVGIRSDGTTFAWGSNSVINTIPSAARTGIVAVAAGNSHGLALRTDGHVVGWGNNTSGEINIPGHIQGSVIAIAAYGQRSAAVYADGRVVVWGANSSTSAPPSTLTGAVAVTLGDQATVVLKTDASVITWDGFGSTPSTQPASLSSDILAIASAPYRNLALKSDGTITTWSSTNVVSPARFLLPLLDAPVRDYHVWAERRAPALLSALTLAAPGAGTLAPAFDSITPAYTFSTPTPYESFALYGTPFVSHPQIDLVRGGTAPVSVRTGHTFANSDLCGIALKPDGGLRTWGVLGAIPASAQSEVTQIAAALYHAAVLKADGTVVIWGLSSSFPYVISPPAGLKATILSAGPKMFAAITHTGLPVVMGNPGDLPIASPPSDATDLIALAVSDRAIAALRRDGRVVTWGSLTGPITVPSDAQTQVVAIAAGNNHFLALRSDGRVVSWGNNSLGQTAVPPAATYGVVAIAGNSRQSFALKADGSLIVWGAGPVLSIPAGQEPDLVAIQAQGNSAIALRRDGTLLTLSAGSSPLPADLGSLALPLHARQSLSLGANSVGLNPASRHPDDAGGAYTFSLSRIPAPALALVLGTDTSPAQRQLDGVGAFHFGLQGVATTSAPRTFTVLNSGDADLVIGNADFSGSHPTEFTLSGLSFPLTLAPGAQASFSLAATPTALGSRNAVFRLHTNRPGGGGLHHLPVFASGLTLASELASWRTAQFTSADLADPTRESTVWGDLADPDQDGVPNLLEYATNTTPLVAGLSPALVVLDSTDPDAPRLTLSYSRLKQAVTAGLIYSVEWSDTLAPGSWADFGIEETITATTSTTESVSASVSASVPRRFLRLRVSSP